MQGRPDVGLVHTDYEVVNREGLVVERVRVRHSKEPIDRAFVDGHGVFPSTTLVRRDVMIKAGGWDTALYGSQDIDVSARLYNLTGFECVDKVLARKLWRGHGHRERFFDKVMHDEKVLSSKEMVLRRLERRPALSSVQRTALTQNGPVISSAGAGWLLIWDGIPMQGVFTFSLSVMIP